MFGELSVRFTEPVLALRDHVYGPIVTDLQAEGRHEANRRFTEVDFPKWRDRFNSHATPDTRIQTHGRSPSVTKLVRQYSWGYRAPVNVHVRGLIGLSAGPSRQDRVFDDMSSLDLYERELGWVGSAVRMVLLSANAWDDKLGRAYGQTISGETFSFEHPRAETERQATEAAWQSWREACRRWQDQMYETGAVYASCTRAGLYGQASVGDDQQVSKAIAADNVPEVAYPTGRTRRLDPFVAHQINYRKSTVYWQSEGVALFPGSTP